MQPLDDRMPEEMDTRNAAIIAFLGRVYAEEKRDDDNEDEAMGTVEQAVIHVRQRLLWHIQTTALPVPQTTRPEGRRAPAPQRQESWRRHLNALALVAVIIALLSSSVFVFGLAKKHKLEQGKGISPTSGTYITPTRHGNRLIGDMLYADQVSRYVLSQGQLVQLNQSQMVDGYQVTLDRAYADANILILGIYAVMPYGPQADKDGRRDANFFAEGDHIRLTTTGGAQLPVLDVSHAMDTGNRQYEQRGLLLDFDTAAIAGSPRQITLNFQIGVHCQGLSPRYSCPRTVQFSFTVPFQSGRQVLTPHQSVTMNGITFTLEKVVITPSEARFYIGGWSKGMFQQPSLDPNHPPQSYDETWYKAKLSVQGNVHDLCTLMNPLNCPQGARTGASLPLHSGIQFESDGPINPVYLNNDQTILGFSLLEPFKEHGVATVTITKQLLHFVKMKQPGSSGYVGTGSPVDDKSVSPWVLTFTLP
jgi:hypothetical protein